MCGFYSPASSSGGYLMNEGETPDVLEGGPLGRTCCPTALLSHSEAVTSQQFINVNGHEVHEKRKAECSASA